MAERNKVFPCFYHEIVSYCAELVDCSFNFKFSENILIFSVFLNIDTNQTSKEQDLNFIRSRQLFCGQPERDVAEVKCQACKVTKK